MHESSVTPPSTADERGKDALFEQVYARLKGLAGASLARAPHAESLDATALVHELYLRMGQRESLQFQQSSQFFAYAARALRHLLLDRARNRMRLHAGGDWQRVTLTDDGGAFALECAEQALDLEQALSKLEAIDARAAQVVELRCFAGLSLEQAADTLGLTRRTIDRDWRFARAFLHAELQ